MLADTDPTERARDVHRPTRAVLGPSSLAVGCGSYRSAAFALFAWMSGLLRRFKWHSVEQAASPCQYDAFELRMSSFGNKTAPQEVVRHRSSPRTRRRRQERWHADHLLWIIDETKAVETPI